MELRSVKNITDHGSLGGLTDDDHAQYLLVNGTRPMTGNLTLGGNELIGDSIAGGDLQLRSTSHATKGKILLGDNSAYDDINKRLSIGTLIADQSLHIVSQGAGDGFVITGTTSTSPGLRLKEDDDRQAQNLLVLNDGVGLDAAVAGDYIIKTIGTNRGDVLIGSNVTTVMRVANNTTVGIGTGSDAPLSLLHLKKAVGTLTLEGANSGAGSPIFSIEWINTDVTSRYTAAKIESFNTGATDDGDLRFYTTQNTVNAEQMRIDEDGNMGLSVATPVISGTGKLHMNADTFRLDTARTPASAGASGNQGEISWDSTYIYICIATNTWQRVAHATW